MPERDIMGALDYLRALTEYIEKLVRVRNLAHELAQAVLEDDPNAKSDARVLFAHIRIADDANPVMRCGS